MPIRPLLLGHRGARIEKSIPENSLASFDRALAHGCDGFEFDVRRTLDGQPVICHDASIQGREVAQSTVPTLTLPLLQDILQRYQTSAFLDVELKVPGLESVTLELLRTFPARRGYVISSFLPEALQTIHDMDGTIVLGLICETQVQANLWPTLPVSFVILHSKLVTASLIAQIKATGRKVFVWTVNSKSQMLKFARWKVDGIISDDPARLVSTLHPQAENKGKR
ncbi:MAG TPA: glycerophosphodiester phosphodiesterase [Candidatus Deferrimicrobiaceae bacterium]|nr:glycerophosphodiester phosphodiesterase [Candidatus Deferrimicrobiaceae bacterium]